MIQLTCPTCGKTGRLKTALPIGTKVTCKGCGMPFRAEAPLPTSENWPSGLAGLDLSGPVSGPITPGPAMTTFRPPSAERKRRTPHWAWIVALLASNVCVGIAAYALGLRATQATTSPAGRQIAAAPRAEPAAPAGPRDIPGDEDLDEAWAMYAHEALTAAQARPDNPNARSDVFVAQDEYSRALDRFLNRNREPIRALTPYFVEAEPDIGLNALAASRKLRALGHFSRAKDILQGTVDFVNQIAGKDSRIVGRSSYSAIMSAYATSRAAGLSHVAAIEKMVDAVAKLRSDPEFLPPLQ